MSETEMAAKVRDVLALQHLAAHVRDLSRVAKLEALDLAGWKKVYVEGALNPRNKVLRLKHPDHPRPSSVRCWVDTWSPATAWGTELRKFKASHPVGPCLACSLAVMGMVGVPHSDRCEVARGCLRADARVGGTS